MIVASQDEFWCLLLVVFVAIRRNSEAFLKAGLAARGCFISVAVGNMVVYKR